MMEKFDVRHKYMRRFLVLLLAAIIFAAVFAGCASPTSSVVTNSSAPESPSYTPVPTTPPDTTPGPDPTEEGMDEDMQAVTVNGMTYYLDINDPVVVDYSEDPPLHMKKEDGSNDQLMGIRGFKFDIIGNFIYVDSNDPDLDESGTQTWSTTRMNLDGSAQTRLEYGSMSARVIPEGEQKFYFTTLGDCAIYISDFACENVQALVLTLPDKSKIEGRVGADKVLHVSISEITSGIINFDVTMSSADGLLLYKGGYKIAENGQTVEKTDDGTYYTYGSNENE